MSYADKIQEYLKAAGVRSHTGKLIAFSDLLKSVFGLSSYEIVQNVEQYVKAGGLLVLKGRMDMWLGQTVMEFKIDLTRELDDAIEEIERYSTILRKNGQKIAECIITDGKKFKVFTVRDKAREVREVNFEGVSPKQAIMFLDTYLFSGRKVPTAEDLNWRFGPGSPIYEDLVGELTSVFENLKERIEQFTKFLGIMEELI